METEPFKFHVIYTFQRGKESAQEEEKFTAHRAPSEAEFLTLALGAIKPDALQYLKKISVAQIVPYDNSPIVGWLEKSQGKYLFD